jgi:anion-transporting  ArsA/GET3 family ATPase
MGDMLARSRIFQYLAAATPGLKELVTIGKIWELAQLDRRVKKGRKYDLVIVDAPATGHGIGFLQTPRTFANIARVGPIASQGEELNKFITDHSSTGVAIVALPEEMPVNESRTLERGLVDDIGVQVDSVYANAVYPQLFDDKEVDRLRTALEESDTNDAASAAMRKALSERARADAQREQLMRLNELVDAPVSTLPFIFQPQLEVQDLERLGEEIAANEEGS